MRTKMIASSSVSLCPESEARKLEHCRSKIGGNIKNTKIVRRGFLLFKYNNI